jgi:hypothetical protein
MAQLRSIDGSGQIGMDERVIEDKALADLLERRLRLGDDKREIGRSYKAADAEARDAIAKLELADGDAVRVGRFRIARVAVPPPLGGVRRRRHEPSADHALRVVA